MATTEALNAVLRKDRLRSQNRAARLATETALIAEDEAADPTDHAAVPDERLRLIFACCHPALEEKTGVSLTLRSLCRLTTAEVARLFLVPKRQWASACHAPGAGSPRQAFCQPWPVWAAPMPPAPPMTGPSAMLQVQKTPLFWPDGAVCCPKTGICRFAKKRPSFRSAEVQQGGMKSARARSSPPSRVDLGGVDWWFKR